MRICFKNFTFFALAAVVLTACASNRPAVNSLPLELPARFSAESQSNFCTVVKQSEEWWKEFQDVKLNELMERAFTDNLDIAMAYERIEKARAVMGVTHSAEGLTAGVTAVAGQNRIGGITGITSIAGRTTDRYKLSGAASYELDLWGKLSARTDAARYDMKASEYDLQALYISVSAELARQYFTAVERSEQLEILRLMVLTAEQKLSLTEQRYSAGLVSAQELFTAKENVAITKVRLPPVEAERAKASHAVSVLTGVLPKSKIDGISTSLSRPPDLPRLLPSTLINRRPDLQAALYRVRADNSRVGAAIADRFPSFSLTGEYGGSSISLSSLLDTPNIFWSILSQAVMPVLDGGRRKAEIAKNKALFDESTLQYRKNLLVAFQDVEGALEESRSADTTLLLSSNRYGAAGGALEVVTDEYRNGVGDYMDLLTQRQRMYESVIAMISAKNKLITARITVIRSLGGTFMEKRISDRASR